MLKHNLYEAVSNEFYLVSANFQEFQVHPLLFGITDSEVRFTCRITHNGVLEYASTLKDVQNLKVDMSLHGIGEVCLPVRFSHFNIDDIGYLSAGKIPIIEFVYKRRL
ncbi:hypothetical protein NVP1101O_102 [Vibrio phage 1.101.O._10N.261.45.C6]|nr:hypothetical protein NVP1101O_102 [Vibrio phage 1.101.O._10N.261.45.C6]